MGLLDFRHAAPVHSRGSDCAVSVARSTLQWRSSFSFATCLSLFSTRESECGMPSVTPLQLVFIAYNAAAGLLVGLLSAFSPAFERLNIPVFGWLIAAMFAFELVAGLVLKVHPSTAISMLVRMAALVISFAICFLTLATLKPA